MCSMLVHRIRNEDGGVEKKTENDEKLRVSCSLQLTPLLDFALPVHVLSYTRCLLAFRLPAAVLPKRACVRTNSRKTVFVCSFLPLGPPPLLPAVDHARVRKKDEGRA